MLTIYMENLEIPVGKSNGMCIIAFGVLLKLQASGQSDAFLLLLLGFTADFIHFACYPSSVRQAKSFRLFYAENFHPGGLCKW